MTGTSDSRTAENTRLASLRALAEHAAREAGRILQDYDGALDIHQKASARDLVSRADLDAERLIVGMLERERPADMIVGEEFGQRRTTGLKWGVDPVDGTSNFLAGIPHWCVCIGCEDAKGSLVGAIYDPTRDEMFSASRGGGATLNGIPIRASSCDALESSIAPFGPAWAAEWHDYRIALSDRLLKAIAHGRQMGSLALDLAWTAAGRFDFFYYDSDLNPWDIGVRVIAEEAGLVTLVLPAAEGLPGALLACPPALLNKLQPVLGRPL